MKLAIGFEIVGKDMFGPIARVETVEYMPSPHAQQSDANLYKAVVHFLSYTQAGWQFCNYEGLDGIEQHLYISNFTL